MGNFEQIRIAVNSLDNADGLMEITNCLRGIDYTENLKNRKKFSIFLSKFFKAYNNLDLFEQTFNLFNSSKTVEAAVRDKKIKNS